MLQFVETDTPISPFWGDISIVIVPSSEASVYKLKRHKFCTFDIMEKIEMPAEAAKKLEEIQDKYDIFFKVNNKPFWDYFELNFNPFATLVLKENCKVPFTLINDLKKEFTLVER